ncbi:MAG: ABC transporter permease [Acidobacteria bacterium]|nr:ABC transporter permease [Acidobacteriota bacterium]
MVGLLRDLAFSTRALARAPLLLTAAVLTLALGIGLSTGVFAVAYGLLVRPLPFGEPSRLVIVSIYRASQPDTDVGVKLSDVEEWRRRARAFERLAAHSSTAFTLRGAGEPRSVRAAMVTNGFFEVLGAPAAEGSPSGVAATNPQAAFSHRLSAQLERDGTWRERGVSIGAGHFTVSAVMPPTFTYPSEEIDLWVPAAAVPRIAFFANDDQRDFHLVARLAPGVTLAQAQEDAARVAAELNQGLTEPRKKYASVRSLDAELRRDSRTTMVPFTVGATLVLLISCANASGLLVGRAAARRREFAVRRALGGGAAHLLRASFAESAVIAFLGWVLGLALAHLVIRAFVAFGAGAVPNLHAARVDLPVIAGSLVLAVLVGMVSGAAPALRALRSDPNGVLKQGSGGMGPFGGVVRSGLVVTQIALTVVLLVCAGLLTRTVMKIVAAERGFELQHALASRLMLSETVRFNVTERAEFLDRLLTEVRVLPGVVAAGIGSDLPPRDTQFRMTIRVVRDGTSEVFALSFAAVTPGYLEALGTKLLAGRTFEDRDRFSSVPAVVISETAARRMFRDTDAIGREWPATIPTPAGNVKPRIIGVVRDVKYGGLDREAPAAIFAPWERVAPSQAYLVIRTAGDPMTLSTAVRQTVQRLDPNLPVFTPQTLEEVVAGSLAERRLQLQLALVFAGLALLLASVALWAAVAQGVIERRRELAIRMALGSTDTGAVRLVVRGGVTLIGGGLAIGVAGAGVSARELQHLLHGVAPLDPLTFVAGTTVAAALSLLACYAPARRAASINPAELLREG